MDQAPEADIIIVLGGFAGTSVHGVPDFAGAIDRALAAVDLYKADRAGAILIAGGNQSWSDDARAEGEIVADLLVELGILREALVIEGESRNTR